MDSAALRILAYLLFVNFPLANKLVTSYRYFRGVLLVNVYIRDCTRSFFLHHGIVRT